MKLPAPVAEIEFFVDEHGPELTFAPCWYGHLVNGTHNLFTEAQILELLSKQEAVMQRALEVIELHPYPGWDHVWETKQALKRALNLKD